MCLLYNFPQSDEGIFKMIFGKHINKYYLKHIGMLLLGILSLFLVDFFQLKVPELYRTVIDGINYGEVDLNGVLYTFNLDFLLDKVCAPLILVILAMVFGRFLWRICLFGSAIKVETELRGEMFEHSKKLSQEYYSKNKVGNLMSLYTNDLETINECFGDGVLMAADALLLGVLAVYKMVRMNPLLTLFCLVPMLLLLAVGTLLGKTMMKKWEARQAAFSELSDFSQESFSGLAVIKAFANEGRSSRSSASFGLSRSSTRKTRR